MQQALQVFKRKLTNLSSANPYLWLRRLKADYFLDLTEVESVTTVPVWQMLDQLLGGKKTVTLAPVADVRDPHLLPLSTKLAALVKKQKLVIEERGANDLHLAFPFVLGRWPDGSWVRTPLLLVPVALMKVKNNWVLAPNLDEAFFNPAFLLAYAFHFRQPLASGFFDKTLEIEAEDGLRFLTLLYEKLKESNLEIHFNQALFAQKIHPFRSLAKEELPGDIHEGMLKLQPEAVLGLFPQSDSILIPDFQFLEDHAVRLEDIFFKNPPFNQDITEKNMLCPLAMDGSQEESVRFIKRGNSAVIQGPPGTGKSQLISNLMADAMGSGKSVLLVCQKKVALEVVQRRLSEIGLGSFIGMWADFKNDKNQIYAQIASQIQNLEEAQKANNKLDTVVLERQFALACQAIDRVVERLEDWKKVLFETEPAGISAHELYHTVGAKRSLFESELLVRFHLAEWLNFMDWFAENQASFFASLHPSSPLAGRSNWFLLHPESVGRVRQIIEKEAVKARQLKDSWDACRWASGQNWENELSVLNQCLSLVEAHTQVAELQDAAFVLRYAPTQWVESSFLSKLQGKISEIATLLKSLTPWPSGVSYSKKEVENLLGITHQQPRWRFLKLVFPVISLFSPQLKAVKAALRNHGLGVQQLDLLVQKLGVALELFQKSEDVFRAEAKEINASALHSFSQQVEAFQKASPYFHKVISSLHKVAGSYAPPQSWEGLYSEAAIVQKMQVAAESILKNWQIYFPGEGQIQLILEGYEAKADALKRAEKEVYSTDKALAETIATWKMMAQQVVAVFAPLQMSKASILAEIDLAWQHNWIVQLEKHHSVLAETGSELWNEALVLLREKIEEKNRLVVQILQLKLREGTYKNLEYNRLGNRTSYRELEHQVNKKRQRIPMRKLWEAYGEDVKRLVPAWLATPESVSATWPMDSRFDLVIFDEASQCFAEKGIPSAFRGNQIVVVGDDKQLPPHQIFSARWEEETEGDDALFSEQDSLLDLAKQFLPQRMLTQHYRSHYPELISFSNRHFYNEKLDVVPLPETLKARAPAIAYKLTEGQWNNQRNEAEAAFLCEGVLEFLQAHPLESVGIITFNARQQMLIEDLLEQMAGEKSIQLPENLFIKNIENVQGDERDHIWFSIGYAKADNGRVVSQFGSLGIAGGENRLNVAISRARLSITVVASIRPEAFPANESSPLGPQLLKAFLHYAWAFQAAGEVRFETQATSGEVISHIKGKPENGEIILLLPFADHAVVSPSGGVRLHFSDGARLHSNISTKDYYALKYSTLTAKGYAVFYHYARSAWAEGSV